MNKLAVANEPLIYFDNTAVAITLIITAGVFCIYKTHIDAKYHRKTFFSYDKCNRFKFVSRPATANTKIVRSA